MLHVDASSLTLANSFTYDTWGAATVTTHNGRPDLGFRFRYVGQQGVQDDTVVGLPLLLMGARHYAPGLARFIQPDPVALEENQYAYAGNNPVTYAGRALSDFVRWALSIASCRRSRSSEATRLLTAAGGSPVTYDSAGRTQTYAGWFYEYDPEGWLIRGLLSVPWAAQSSPS